ncbi:MAG: hypothetical protein ACOYOV_13710 [Bacteroidales bacterium]
MKKYIILFVMLLFFSNYTKGNQSNNNSEQQPTKKEWKLLFEKNGVQVYAIYEDCDDIINGIHQENAVLKFVNTTDRNLSIDWDLKIWYNGSCVNCDKNEKEHHFATHLKAGETKRGSCETRNINRELVIFSKFLNMENKSVLTNFELQNVQVKPL